MTIATAATLFTFNLEWVLHRVFHKRMLHQEIARAEAAKTLDTEAALAEADKVKIECAGRLSKLQNIVSSYTFECGIIFHSRCLLTSSMPAVMLMALLRLFRMCIVDHKRFDLLA